MNLFVAQITITMDFFAARITFCIDFFVARITFMYEIISWLVPDFEFMVLNMKYIGTQNCLR